METNTIVGRSPLNVIFLVSDGMSAGVLPLAERFSHLVRQRGTHWTGLLRRRDAAHGQFEMASLNSPVPDSAAASSSWGSGVLVRNAMVNTLPDSRRLTSIAELARDSGRRIGLVSTAAVTHATPAGFAASQPRRDEEHLIAPQYLNRADVILGGGGNSFHPESRPDRVDLSAEFQGNGYGFAQTKADLVNSPGGKLLGLFSASHFPYALDRRHNSELQSRFPTLAEMTSAALDRLEPHTGGFLLQVEGARIDHAAHNNDTATLLWEQLDFDDALGVALEFQAQHPGTLVVVTSDHGTGNPVLNGMGHEYCGTAGCFDRLRQARTSFELLFARLGGCADYQGIEKCRAAGVPPPVNLLRQIVAQDTGVQLDRREAQVLAECIAGRRAIDWARWHESPECLLARIIAEHTGIGWSGCHHTAERTVVTALGPGAADFHGLLPSTAAFEILTHHFGISFRNPSMSPEQAEPFAATGPDVLPHCA